MFFSPRGSTTSLEPILPLSRPICTAAYSIYALFEWSLIVLDVSFDCLYILDFSPSSTSSSAVSTTSALSFFIASTPQPSPSEPPSTDPNALGDLAKMLAKVEMATSAIRKSASETYLAFVFFTLLVGLGPAIFYNRRVDFLHFNSVTPADLASSL